MKIKSNIRWIFLTMILVILAGSAFTAKAEGLQPAKPVYQSPRSTSATNTSVQASNLQASSDPVNLVWFYKPPQDGDLSKISSSFDTFILTKNDEAERDALVAMGETQQILEYLRFEAIMDPGGCQSQPWRNQVADRVGDFCQISSEHPDWFLLDESGERIYDSDGFVMMDPGHQGWREFWLERAIYNQEVLGWNGVFLDNVEASLGKYRRMGRELQQYPDDATFQAAVEGFLTFMAEQYFRPAGRPLLANIIYLDESEVWFRYLQYLDGAMEEGWAVDWSQGYLSPNEWLSHIERAAQTQQQGDFGIFVAQGEEYDEQRQTFAYASYLLISQGRASFRYAHYNSYDEAWLYPNYQLELGQPLGERYLQDGLWTRDFENGQVRVDPENQTAEIALKVSYEGKQLTFVPMVVNP